MASPPTSPPSSPFLPPSSPLECSSPGTSPVRDISPQSSSQASSRSSSSSPTLSVSPSPKKRRKECRTTIQRRQRRLMEFANDGEVGDEGSHDRNSIQELQPPGNSCRSLDSYAADSGPPDIPSDSDCSSDDSGRSESASSSSATSTLCAGSEDSNYESDSSVASAESIDYLFEGSAVTSQEALLQVLKLFVEERWTKHSLDKNIKVIRSLLPHPNKLPPSGKAALKKLQDLTSTFKETEHLYCSECLQLSETCNHEASQKKFFSFPIDQQIKHMFEQRGLAPILDSYRNHASKKPGFICDMCDGSEYRKVKEHLPGNYDLVLLWNTDGVALSSSSNVELWPILCIIAEVPPRLRSSFVVVAGVYVGEKHPDMNVFLKPFSDSLKRLWTDGVSWTDPTTHNIHVSKIVAPVLTADAPAKAQVLKSKNHNSRYGCLVCEQKSKRIEIAVRATVKNKNQRLKVRRIRRLLFQDDVAPAPLRTGHRMNLLGELAERREKSRKGVTGRAIITEIPFLNRVLCQSAEYMHLILLGVVKYFLLKIFTKQGPWNIANKLGEINKFILNEIKVPDFINRLPRTIKDLKYWKASELRAFLLFYLLPIFKEFEFPAKYYQHWILLTGAVHLLLQENISENDLMSAELMLKSFVRDVKDLYGEDCYTYNVHNLLHLCLLVRRWGPLWATSAFPFESFNGFLGAHVHGTKNLGQELITNIKISQSVLILENIVNSANYQQPLPKGADGLLGKPVQKEALTDREQGVIESSELGIYALHKRAKYSSQIYTSKLYDDSKKRANSFIEYRPANNSPFKFGQILVFLKAEDGSLYCLVRAFQIVNLDLLFHENSRHVIRNVLPFQESDILQLIPINSIITKILKIGKYIGIRPNSYEVQL